MKKNIAVIEGGFSSEAEISYKSAKTVRENLDANLYNIWQVALTKEKWVVKVDEKEYVIDKSDFSFTVSEKISFDAAFIMIHGTPGEDGKLQGYFDMLDIPYTGCNQFSSALTFNKFYCNKALKSMGIACAKGVYLTSNMDYSKDAIVSEVGLPCFVKPADGGSSFGASKVDDIEDLAPAINQAFKHGEFVIIEEYLSGVEVTNGVYKSNGKVTALAITEIATDNEFFDFEAKYKGESDEITPARISNEMTETIKQLSEHVYRLLHLNGVCRIDYIIQDNTPYLIEVNTIPGQSSESLIPQQIEYAGKTLSEFYNSLMADVLS